MEISRFFGVWTGPGSPPQYNSGYSQLSIDILYLFFSQYVSICKQTSILGSTAIFCICVCFFHKNTLQIIPNTSCMLFTFNRIGSSCVSMSEIDGLGQLTSDDLWGLMLLHNKCKQFQKLILKRAFLPYSFVRPRHNLCNLTRYMFDNVQNLR